MEIGPGKLLRVMAGDTIHINANSWWKTAGDPQCKLPHFSDHSKLEFFGFSNSRETD